MGEREQQANATMTTRCCPARAGGQPIHPVNPNLLP